MLGTRRDVVLGTRTHTQSTRTRTRGLGTRTRGLGTRTRGLGTRTRGLGTRTRGFSTRTRIRGTCILRYLTYRVCLVHSLPVAFYLLASSR